MKSSFITSNAFYTKVIHYLGSLTNYKNRPFAFSGAYGSDNTVELYDFRSETWETKPEWDSPFSSKGYVYSPIWPEMVWSQKFNLKGVS